MWLWTSPEEEAPDEGIISTRYPVLGIVITVLEIFAWITFAASIVVFMINLNADGDLWLNVVRLIGGLIAWALLLAIAMGLRVLLDVESNTRRTTELLENAPWNQPRDGSSQRD